MSIESARQAFEAASDGRLRLAHADMHYTSDQKQVLSFSGFRADGTPFSIATDPFMGSVVLKAMAVARGLLTQTPQSTPPLVLTDKPQTTTTLQGQGQFDRNLSKATEDINRKMRMAMPSAAADRLRAFRQKMSDETDKLIGEIDAAEKTDLPNAFAQGHQYLAGQKAELDGFKAELAQLTNLPLDGSQK